MLFCLFLSIKIKTLFQSVYQKIKISFKSETIQAPFILARNDKKVDFKYHIATRLGNVLNMVQNYLGKQRKKTLCTHKKTCSQAA